MPANVVNSVLSGNAVLSAIDGGTRWSGEITYNRVEPFVTAETGAFAAALPSIYVTQGIGLTDPMWALVVRSLDVLRTFAAFDYQLTDAIDANYFVSDFSRPTNTDVAGIAARPSSTPILAFNVGTFPVYSAQLQAWIVLHELGHTLGLQHVTGLPASLDYSQYTVMSYDWFSLGDEDLAQGLPLTPMALDVAVLQAKYGAASANLGDTRYSLSRSLLDLAGSDGLVLNGAGYVCIWDSGGVDTLSVGGFGNALLNLNAATLDTATPSGDLADVLADVAASSRIFGSLSAQAQAEMMDPARSAGGFFSSFLNGAARDPAGYVIANGARIEAASGGSFDDLLIGNRFANTLAGNGGGDDLFGGSGDDSVQGGAGDDRAYGGLGADTLQDGEGTNYLRGDEGSDSIDGGSGFDDANGNMGDDTVATGAGEDYCVGGKDNDSLSGGADYDLVYGNLGSDTCDGGDGDDIVRGGQDGDLVIGGAGADFVSGDKGDDTMTGGAGADLFHTFGDAGLDRVTDFSLADGDRVQLDPGTQFSVSQSGADTVIDMTGGGRMVLVGVQMSTLTPGWIFGA